MGFVIYGTKKNPVGIDEFFVQCPSCEAHNWADVMVVSHYWHMYFIPFWPTDKSAHVTCQKCGLTRSGIYFDKRLIDNYDEVKRRFRHPWYAYIGLGICILIVLLILYAVLTQL